MNAMTKQRKETKLSQVIHWIDKLKALEDQPKGPSQHRKVTTLKAKISAAIQQLIPDRHNQIMEEINGDIDHRQAALEWIKAEITQVSIDKQQDLNKRTQNKHIQDAYSEDPGTTFRRYIDQKVSPLCDIPIDEIQTAYEEIWSQETEPIDESEEVPSVTPLPEEYSQEIIDFILDIEAVVKTRKKLQL